MPADQDDVGLGAGRAGHREPGGRPLDAPLLALGLGDRRPVDLEVVELLRVELGDRLGRPDLLQVLDGGGRGVGGVVPPLEGRDGHGGAQHRQPVELAHAHQPNAPSRITRLWPRRRAAGGTLRLYGRDASAFLEVLADRVLDRRRGDGHDAARGRARPWTTTRVTRAAARSSTSPGPTSCAASTTPTWPPAPTASRPTRSAPTSSALGEYGIADRIFELSQVGARLAREVADGYATAERPRFVLGSIGPGTKLPTLGHTTYAALRDAYEQNAAGLLAGGADALIVETCQDLLQTKAAVVGSRRAIAASRPRRPADLPRHRRDHRHDAARLGDRRRADRARAARHRPDRAQLRHRAGRDVRAPALPVAARPGAAVGHAQRRPARAHRRPAPRYPLQPDGAGRGDAPVRHRVRRPAGRRLLRHDARAHPAGRRGGRAASTPAGAHADAGRRASSSIYHHVPFAQDASVLMVGERTNANGSKAFRDAMLAGDYQRCVEIARDQARDGSHLLDLCVDYVGRDGAARHARAGRPVRHRVDAADHARLDRAERHRGRAGDARRPVRRQLGQLRGRRRARTRGTPGSCRSWPSTAPPWSR